jgi:hypothetical protein
MQFALTSSAVLSLTSISWLLGCGVIPFALCIHYIPIGHAGQALFKLFYQFIPTASGRGLECLSFTVL